MSAQSNPLRLTLALALVLGVALSGKISADGAPLQEEQKSVHWAFATLFGSGWYSIADNRSLFVMRLPARIRLRDSGFNSRSDRGIGFELRLPVTLGLHNIDDIPGIVDPENFGTIAFTPGLDVEIPITGTFYLKPYARYGWGTEFGANYSAWIYQAGIKSSFGFDLGKHQLALLGNIYFAGYSPNVGESDRMNGAGLGIEGKIPLKRLTLAGESLAFNWHILYNSFGNRPVFGRRGDNPEIVGELIEFGVALSPGEGRWNFLGWKPDRLGLAYEYDPGGNFSAITFNFTSWLLR